MIGKIKITPKTKGGAILVKSFPKWESAAKKSI
jgi:hypothetical protein